MVKIINIVVHIIFPLFVFCQNDSISYNIESEMVNAIESWPEYKGDLTDFIKRQIQYPSIALEDSIEGKVYVAFWVDSVGNTYKHVILKGIRKDINREALRVARLIKFDKPAMQKGRPVAVRYNLPIEFKLPRSDEFP
jgi:protein TonB